MAMDESSMHDSSVKRQPSPKSVFCNYLGLIVLLIGLLAALLIFFYGAKDSGHVSGTDPMSGKLYEQSIVAIGGEAALRAVRVNQWLAGFLHRRSLAMTVAVFALLVALGCFWIGRLLSLPAAGGQNNRHEA
jgi:hypothetical protein